MIFIYVLIDPRTLEVRYVGQTNNPKERLRAHISPHVYMRHNNKKAIWTEELKASGHKPVMQVLFTCQAHDANLWEHHFIKTFKSCGLLNSAEVVKETFQFDLSYSQKSV
jgi:hypothetical protein